MRLKYDNATCLGPGSGVRRRASGAAGDLRPREAAAAQRDRRRAECGGSPHPRRRLPGWKGRRTSPRTDAAALRACPHRAVGRFWGCGSPSSGIRTWRAGVRPGRSAADLAARPSCRRRRRRRSRGRPRARRGSPRGSAVAGSACRPTRIPATAATYAGSALASPAAVDHLRRCRAGCPSASAGKRSAATWPGRGGVQRRRLRLVHPEDHSLADQGEWCASLRGRGLRGQRHVRPRARRGPSTWSSWPRSPTCQERAPDLLAPRPPPRPGAVPPDVPRSRAVRPRVPPLGLHLRRRPRGRLPAGGFFVSR